ncbi:MAG TPA: FG-GAP-like repeat-containing protein, partial [Blastocatellia bacterium]|nr:FG-GAP-like repeat-containing protein [Blastocatellia bacterium]
MAHLNLCVALFNLPDVPASLVEAKLSAQLLPDKPHPYYMLGMIDRTQNRTEEAISAFKRVVEIDPNDVGGNVNLGQLYSSVRKFPEAIEVLRKALAAEPYNVTASYNMAIALLRDGKTKEGQEMMARFQKLRESGYGTTIGTKYMEQGRYSEAISSTGQEPEVVDQATPEVGFTSETSPTAASGTNPKEAPANPVPAFGRRLKANELTDSVKRNLAASVGGGVTLFDFDGDGYLDMFVVTANEQHLYKNHCGTFVDITKGSGLENVPSGAIGIGAVAGDYDNDGKPDLFVLRYGRCSLYHNDGNGKFTERTESAGIPSYPYLALSAAFVDVDHDGDLDIFIAGFADLAKVPAGDPDRSLAFPDDFGAAPNLLLRNDGNGKFTEITSKAGLSNTGGHAVAIVPTDFDNDRAVDLFVLNYGAAPVLFRNLRDGSFRDVAAGIGLNTAGKYTAVAAGDFNKDGYTDFFLGNADGPGVIEMSDGRGHFAAAAGPESSANAKAAQFVDYDNDGLLDLLVINQSGLHVFRNAGSNGPGGPKWNDVSPRAVPSDLLPASSIQDLRSFAAGDVDLDGDTDLVVPLSTGEFKVCKNDGGTKNHSIRVRLAGKFSNRSGIGSKAEVRAGSLWQKLETSSASPAPYPADIVFGLGPRTVPDAVRILWPSGTVQAETKFADAGSISAAEGKNIAPAAQTEKGPCPVSGLAILVTELDRKPSSCPFLYTWNGERFEFVTDFMGGGEMGSWEGPGERNVPDPDEYVRIPADQLKPRDGRYDIRVTNELEEVMYVDRLQLVAV